MCSTQCTMSARLLCGKRTQPLSIGGRTTCPYLLQHPPAAHVIAVRTARATADTFASPFPSPSPASPSPSFPQPAALQDETPGSMPQQYSRLLQELSSQLRPSTATSSSRGSNAAAVTNGNLALTLAGQEQCRQLAQLLVQHPDKRLQPEVAVKTAQLLSIIHKHVPARTFSSCCMPLTECLLQRLCIPAALSKFSLRQTSILLQAMLHLPCSSHQQLLQQGMVHLQQLGSTAWVSKEVVPATVSCTLWAYAMGRVSQHYGSAFLKPLLDGVQAAVAAGVMDVKGATSHWSSALLSCARLQVPVSELQLVWQRGVQALAQALLQATANSQQESRQQQQQQRQHGVNRQPQQHMGDVHVLPQDVSSTLWACVNAGYHDTEHDGAGMHELLAAVGNAVEAGLMDDASPLQWAHLFWARSQLEPRPSAHELAVMSQHLQMAVSAHHFKHATAMQWANLLWGASRLGIAVSDLYLAWDAAIPVLEAAMRGGRPKCSGQDVSMVLVAAAKSKHVDAYHTWLAAAAAGVVQGGLLEDADAGSLAWILWALAEDWPITRSSAELREAAETLTSSCTLQLTGQVEEGGTALLQADEGQQHLPRAVAALSSMDVMPPALHAACVSQELC